MPNLPDNHKSGLVAFCLGGRWMHDDELTRKQDAFNTPSYIFPHIHTTAGDIQFERSIQQPMVPAVNVTVMLRQ